LALITLSSWRRRSCPSAIIALPARSVGLSGQEG
jgi:hypothetical protein